eukprot:gnl/TRDRNA2_/TRDRNA2_175107_c1_seq1.p2 gnl/TRDRNA2_/TRDRNA2_175107_c1~~gnl/TRDRNA2_/TRDRNA2_175107_c1_seq1.p2  ORF type:complete len:102 (-),score=27.89 gnl/TRDRNA2_/TRDRNA2_175107_c1_seq1:366-671(-)
MKPFDEAAELAAMTFMTEHEHGKTCFEEISQMAKDMDDNNVQDDDEIVKFTKKLAKKLYGTVKEGWEKTLVASLESDDGVSSPATMCKLLIEYYDVKHEEL